MMNNVTWQKRTIPAAGLLVALVLLLFAFAVQPAATANSVVNDTGEIIADAQGAQLTVAKATLPAGGTGFPFTIDPGAYSFDFKWGTEGGGNGEFFFPQGVAFDDAGDFYVADTGNNRIQKFDSSGTYLIQWGTLGNGNGQFEAPSGVAVDAAGNVYVADSDDNRIQKFTSAGGYLAQWGTTGTGDGQFRDPNGVAVDAVGNVYVADTFNYRIQKFDSNGTYLTQWGTFGTGDGQFDGPRGVAVDAAGHVYVADTFNNRIQKFDSSGTYLAQWGTSGTGDGQFDWPYGLAVDAAGNVYVADTVNDRIQKFDSSGTYLAQWGTSGTGDGELGIPIGLAVDATGHVYVADTNNGRIQVFTPDLGVTLDDGQSETFIDLAPGNYLVSELVPAGWSVDSISCDGGSPAYDDSSVALTLAGGDDVTCTFTNALPPQLTITKETDPAGGTDFPFTIEGTTPRYSSQFGTGGNGDGEFDRPSYAAIDPATGDILVTDAGNNRVQRFDSSGAFIQAWNGSSSGTAFSNPYGIALDSSGNVFVADWGNHRVVKFDSSGAFLTEWGVNGTAEGEFAFPYEVAVDSGDNVYVVDSQNNRIQQFDNNGSFLAMWGWGVDDGSAAFQTCTSSCEAGISGNGDGQFFFPVGIAIDSADNIYVVELNNRRVQKFDSLFAFVTKWGTTGSGDGQFENPTGIGIDSNDTIYVADRDNDRVQVFDNAGVYLTQFGTTGSGNGQLDSPFDVAVSLSGDVYVVDQSNNRVQVFNIDTFNTSLDDGQSDSFNLLPDTYAVSELVPTGWTLDQIDCGDGIVTGTATVDLTLAPGDEVTCVFSNSRPPSVCPVDVEGVGTERTTLLGSGMGSPTRSKMVAKVTIPNAADVTELYGQMAAKEYSGVKYVRFIFGDKSYQQVPTDGGTFDLGETAAISWWGDDLTTQFQSQNRPFVKGRWFLQKGMKKMRLPRAIVFYPTHDTGDTEYANAWSTFTATDNFVAGTLGFDQTNSNILAIPETQAVTDIVVQLAVTDVNRDARSVDVIVRAGGVEVTTTLTSPTNKKSELLDIFEVTLANVPAGVDEVEIELVSVLDQGDSAALLGAAASYACELPTP